MKEERRNSCPPLNTTKTENAFPGDKVIIEKSRGGRTGIEIWAGFGQVRQLLRQGFSCFHEQKINFKNILDGENIFGIE